MEAPAVKARRKSPNLNQPQSLTRIPGCTDHGRGCGVAFQPGDRVSLVLADGSACVVTVKSLTCAITARGQRAEWRIHSACGRQFVARFVIGHAACVEAARRAERRAAA